MREQLAKGKSNTRSIELILGLFTLVLYSFIFYLFLTQNQTTDFSCFYASLLNLSSDKNPYDSLSHSVFLTVRQLPNNLNPPFFLFLFNPLIKLNFHAAFTIWLLLSLLLGLIAFFITIQHVFSSDFLHKKWLILFLTYLAYYATIINITKAQIGSLLFFMIMAGYHFYLKKNDYLAGFLWGIIISIKLFPGLLFFYALMQGRVKVIVAMTTSIILAFLIPLFMYGTSIYSYYFSLITKISWYNDNWNASLFGYLYRLVVEPSTQKNLLPLEVFYAFIFILFLVYYLKIMKKTYHQESNHQPFCLTLSLMLFLSPLGWLYYFPLLIFPLALTWAKAMKEASSSCKMIVLWCCCFSLLNIPLSYTHFNQHSIAFFRFFTCSIHFYGLLLLIYLVATTPTLTKTETLQVNEKNRSFLVLLFLILFYDVISSIVKVFLES